MLSPPRVTDPPKVQRISMRNWEKGTVTAFDDRRSPLDGLRSSGNLILEQNAIARPRPSLVKYGPKLIGEVLGEIFEFRITNSNGNANWLICIQNVDGEASAYVARGEDSSWSIVAGKTYSTSARAHYIQIDNKILIMNGDDHLSFLDTLTMTITAFAQINDPAAPTLDTKTGFSTATDFKVFYAITANSSIGETAGSPVLEVGVSADRDMWNQDTQNIKIKWAALADAKSYNVYVGIGVDGGGRPTLYRIASGLPTSTLTFTDNGTRGQDLSSPLPEDNSTAGPRTNRGCVANGRPWLVGDRDNPFYVWRGGDHGHELDFSPANGGGYVPVGSGTKEIPTSVKQYRDGKGDAKITVLSQGTNGSGKRFLLSPATISYGSSSFTVWQVQEDTGLDGTDSPDGVIIYNNSLWYPSRDGFKTTGTIPQLQNVLSTSRTSNTIQPDVSTLTTAAMDLCVGLAYEGRLYWAVPVARDRNNQIWVLDVDRKGAWMKPWSISADWMTLYNDNNGRTHFLVLQNNNIYELSYANKTSDDGVPFVTSASSGQVQFSEDGREWGRLLRLIFTLLRPQGSINFTVSGKTEDGIQAYTETRTFGTTATRAGWSEPRAGWSSLRGWGEIKTIPDSFNPASEDVEFEVDEDFQWFQYGLNSTEGGVDYSLSDVVAEYVNIGTKELS